MHLRILCLALFVCLGSAMLESKGYCEENDSACMNAWLQCHGKRPEGDSWLLLRLFWMGKLTVFTGCLKKFGEEGILSGIPEEDPDGGAPPANIIPTNQPSSSNLTPNNQGVAPTNPRISRTSPVSGTSGTPSTSGSSTTSESSGSSTLSDPVTRFRGAIAIRVHQITDEAVRDNVKCCYAQGSEFLDKDQNLVLKTFTDLINQRFNKEPEIKQAHLAALDSCKNLQIYTCDLIPFRDCMYRSCMDQILTKNNNQF